VLSLARVLGLLAKQYPRYADYLNVPRYRLLKRLTRPAARRAEIRACVEREEQIDIDGLVQCTLYDPPVVRADVRVMVKGGQLREVKPPRPAGPGRPPERTLYEVAAGPSQFLAARR